jgi:uncharacterized protein YaiE (UPF0345 family)
MSIRPDLLISVAVWFALGASTAFSQNISVASYGAIPNDGVDDTAAIQAAFNAAAKLPGSIITFAAGTYDISASAGQNQALLLNGATNLTIDGGSATFRVGTPKNALTVSNSSNVVIKNLSFDWKNLSYAQVRTVSFANGVATVQFLAGETPSTTGTTVTSVFLYDLTNGRPAPGDSDWYTSTGLITALPGGLASITGIASNFSRVGIGANLLVRYQTYGATAVFGLSNKDLYLDCVTVNSAPGMGLTFTGCENVVLTRTSVGIPAGSTRWISTNADGAHFTSCRGRITITDCSFEKMGDDAINVGQLMLQSTLGSSNHEIIVQHGAASRQGMPPMHNGDVLQFSAPGAPFTPIFSALVVSGPSTGLPTSMTLTLDRDIPAALRAAAIVYDETAKPTIRISRCTVADNRGRGFWIQGAAGVIDDSVASGCSGSAAELRCDVSKWWEGPAPTNMEFYNCQFEDCNYGPGRNTAIVNTYAQQADGTMSQAAALADLTFYSCAFSGTTPGLSLSSVGVVKTAHCTFSTPAPAIVLTGTATVLDVGGN